jgi:hypothetical protein
MILAKGFAALIATTTAATLVRPIASAWDLRQESQVTVAGGPLAGDIFPTASKLFPPDKLKNLHRF